MASPLHRCPSEEIMRNICLVIALVAGYAVAAEAQDQTIETKTKTKIDVAAGETMVLTGCVRPYGDGGYVLSNASGKNGATTDYVLVSKVDALKDQVGHWVEIKGKAATSRDGRVKIATETKVTPEGGNTTTTERKSKLKDADLASLPYLGVQSIKMLAKSCR
jgi:hypothetical protein